MKNISKILFIVLFFSLFFGESCKRKQDVVSTVSTDTIQTPWLFNTPMPFDQPLTDILQASSKKVFAHYFTQFPISIDNKDPKNDYYESGYLNPNGESGIHIQYGGYLRNRPLPRSPRLESNWMEHDMEEEVRRAIFIGIDGFSCDLLADNGYHLDRVKMLLDAANRIDPRFKIMLMPDMEAFNTNPGKIMDLIKSLSIYPAAYRLNDGRLVVSPYNAQRQTVTWWTTWLSDMKTQGIDIALVPVFQDWEQYKIEYAPICYGMSDWGWRSPKIQQSTKWTEAAIRAEQLTSVWMMPVAPQDMRPNQQVYSEAANSELFKVMWENAINGGSDWVQLVTWNDYSEHACVAPSTGTQYAYYDLAAYYITWFKTGIKPPITRDVLYYYYRIQPTNAPNQQVKPFKTAVGTDAPLNEIELLAFLTEPGTLQIKIGKSVYTKDCQAGLNSFRVPLLLEGRPVFQLLRNNKVVVTLPGAFEIKKSVTYQNLLYYGGSNSRSPVIQ